MNAAHPIFYFDVASPNAYFVHRVLPQIEARTGARFYYVPVLLGGLFKLTGNKAPFVAFAGVPKKIAYEMKEIERFRRKHHLDRYRFNPHFPQNSLKIMRGAVAAQHLGLAERYNEAMLNGMWEQGLKLDDPAIWRQAMMDADLPADQIIETSEQPAIKDRLQANTEAAAKHGAFGIPSFVVGAELFFGKDRLRDVEDEILAQKNAAQ